MAVILQGGEHRQCELPGALPSAWPMAQGRTDPAPQPAPAHPCCMALCCPHAESCGHTPPVPACSSPRRFLTPTRVLRSLTARAPVEMHQKLLSNKLILVQSCRRRFCCSACHNLSRLVQPRHPSRAAQQPAACAQPPEKRCGCGSAAALQPQVRSGGFSSGPSLWRGGFKSSQQCRSIRRGAGVAWVGHGAQVGALCHACVIPGPSSSGAIRLPVQRGQKRKDLLLDALRNWGRGVDAGVGDCRDPPGLGAALPGEMSFLQLRPPLCTMLA